MIENLFQQIIQRLIQYKKPLIIIGIAALLLLVLVRFYSGFAIVNISVNNLSTTTKGSTKVYGTTSTETINLGGPGLKIVRSDIKSLIVKSTDNIQSQTNIDIPWYRYSNKTIALAYDKNATKVPYTNNFRFACSTYDQNNDVLLSYDCRSPLVLSNKKQASINKQTVKLPSFVDDMTAPYMGGIIGLSYSTTQHKNGAVVVASSNGTVSSYALPAAISQDKLPSSRIFTSTFDLGEKNFVLVDGNGTVYLGIPDAAQESEVNYVQFKAPSDYIEDEQQTLCSFSNNDVYCYRGYYAIGDTKASGKPIRETISKLSTSDKTGDIKEISKDRNILDQFSVTSGGEIYGRYYKKLVQFSPEKDIYTPTIVAQNVDMITAGKVLYYVQNSGVFVRPNDSDEAHQLFYSEHVIPSNVYATNNKVFVIGRIKNAGEMLHAYALNDEDNITPGERLVDLLPLPFNQLPNVSRQDFSENNLNLTLKLTINKQARSSTDVIDQGEFNQMKNEVSATLSSNGIDVSNLNITYDY